MKLTFTRAALVALFLQIDKQAHALGCALVVLVLYDLLLPALMALQLDAIAHPVSVMLALAAALVLAWAKEQLYDRKTVGNVKDWGDAWASAAGAVVAAVWQGVLWPVIVKALLS